MSHVEIYILNYNGAHFLPQCLNSLRSLEKGAHSFTVNVVDNGSTDGSEELVRNSYPEVNFLALGANYGFSKGNNRGVAIRREALRKRDEQVDVHVFLNNDTVVDSFWLINALEGFARHPDAGIIGSKSVFYDRFIFLDLETTHTFSPSMFGSADTRELGVYLVTPIQGTNIYLDTPRTKILSAYPKEGRGRWLPKRTRLYIAVQDPTEPAEVKLLIENHNPGLEELEVTISDGEQVLERVNIGRGTEQTITLQVETDSFKDVIQNAGSFVTRDWNAGDCGFMEIDCGQHDKERQVDAVCGVSMFITDSLFADLGGFDEEYFAYFEDTDLSVRGRLLGRKCWYIPSSKLRHVHCGSGIEYSDYFLRNVAYSRLLFLSKLANQRAWRVALKDAFKYARAEFQLFEGDRSLEYKPNLRALCKAVKRLPVFLANRYFQLRHARHALQLTSLGNGHG